MFSKEGMKIGNHWAFFSLGNQVGGSAEVEMLINGASEKTLILWSWEGPLGTPLAVV